MKESQLNEQNTPDRVLKNRIVFAHNDSILEERHQLKYQIDALVWSTLRYYQRRVRPLKLTNERRLATVISGSFGNYNRIVEITHLTGRLMATISLAVPFSLVRIRIICNLDQFTLN